MHTFGCSFQVKIRWRGIYRARGRAQDYAAFTSTLKVMWPSISFSFHLKIKATRAYAPVHLHHNTFILCPITLQYDSITWNGYIQWSLCIQFTEHLFTFDSFHGTYTRYVSLIHVLTQCGYLLWHILFHHIIFMQQREHQRELQMATNTSTLGRLQWLDMQFNMGFTLRQVW